MTDTQSTPTLPTEIGKLIELFEHAINTPHYGQDVNSREEAESCLEQARAAVTAWEQRTSAEVERLTRERDEAVAKYHELGKEACATADELSNAAEYWMKEAHTAQAEAVTLRTALAVTRNTIVMASDYLLWLTEIKGVRLGAVDAVSKAVNETRDALSSTTQAQAVADVVEAATRMGSYLQAGSDYVSVPLKHWTTLQSKLAALTRLPGAAKGAEAVDGNV